MINLKIVLLKNSAGIEFLNRSSQYAYNGDKAESILKVREIGDQVIPNLKSTLLIKDSEKLAEKTKALLLKYAGDQPRFISVWGKSPLQKERCKAFEGSFVKTLIESYPEARLTFKMFKKKPRDPNATPRPVAVAPREKAVLQAREDHLLKENRELKELLNGSVQQKAQAKLWVLSKIHNYKTFCQYVTGSVLNTKRVDPPFVGNKKTGLEQWMEALIEILPELKLTLADFKKIPQRVA